MTDGRGHSDSGSVYSLTEGSQSSLAPRMNVTASHKWTADNPISIQIVCASDSRKDHAHTFLIKSSQRRLQTQKDRAQFHLTLVSEMVYVSPGF